MKAGNDLMSIRAMQAVPSVFWTDRAHPDFSMETVVLIHTPMLVYLSFLLVNISLKKNMPNTKSND